mmetsp:Transcript_24281/g.37845  ORF Transcript_24281/g.37845 Transcript_24281/m.37845 type:complete len:315 (-) Transcript_24281:87-1031(-)|eukprot:CAMPEP_0201528372 /NCGR_PEP_ID=MMETSP0161_2-20130828/38135_1 /ASSEMBLY_ACC=CAM_ASM_000251 /TAXON_ID=180227 /ORGANISM="Neoparamoeba aestuarina, Strain SoJaBio B1-5/56/2" /LENGTH=314 /DNA_ID=CAMNT_0047929629 /DNA_START=72 /DNA_END=1016 /DNA_ORIENTATION=-
MDSPIPKAILDIPRERHSVEIVDGKIYCIAGYGSKKEGEVRTLNTIEYYKEKKNEWVSCKAKHNLCFGRDGLCTVVLEDNTILAIGGRTEEGEYLKSMEVYHPKKGWSMIDIEFKWAGYQSQAVRVGKTVYLIGGESERGVSPATEIITYKNGKWSCKSGPNMNSKRSRFGCCVVDGVIYAVGGFTGPCDTDTMEMLDTNKSNPKWEMCEGKFKTKRNTFATVYLDGGIYAIGGLECGFGLLKTVERYDLEKKEWSYVAELTRYGRCAHAAAVCSGKIAVIGGCYMSGYLPIILDSINVYDPKTNKWELFDQEK